MRVKIQGDGDGVVGKAVRHPCLYDNRTMRCKAIHL